MLLPPRYGDMVSSKGSSSCGSTSTLVSTFTLPDHLWTYICRFLTDEQVRQMYPVNQSLYRISMALRYRVASIGELQGAGSEGTTRCIAIAKNVRLRNNVRSLSFAPTSLSLDSESESHIAETAMKKINDSAFVKFAVSHWKSKIQTPQTPIAPQFAPSNNASSTVTIGRAPLTLSRRKTREQAARDGITSALREFLGNLPNLTDLDIHYPRSLSPSSDENDTTVALLQPPRNETPYGTTLTSLTITCSVVAWKQLIPHHYEWPRLETFRVRVDGGHENPSDDVYAIRLILAPFIRRHSETLKVLSFATNMEQDLTSLYDGIGWLLHLETLELEQPYLAPSNNHTEALGQFLMRHRDSLISFKWTFIASLNGASQTLTLHPQEWFEQAPYHIQLSRLQHLSLVLPGPSNSSFFEGTYFYCARHTSTLTHLSLNGPTLTPAQFQELILLIGSKRLRCLDISLEVLTSAVLMNLATKCPFLQRLHLAYASVGRQKSLTEPVLVDPTAGGILKISNVPVVKTWQFRQDMGALVLVNWNVAELYLRRVADRSWEEYKMDQVGRLIVKSMPKVGFVNGLYREDYV